MACYSTLTSDNLYPSSPYFCTVPGLYQTFCNELNYIYIPYFLPLFCTHYVNHVLFEIHYIYIDTLLNLQTGAVETSTRKLADKIVRERAEDIVDVDRAMGKMEAARRETRHNEKVANGEDSK